MTYILRLSHRIRAAISASKSHAGLNRDPMPASSRRPQNRHKSWRRGTSGKIGEVSRLESGIRKNLTLNNQWTKSKL
jgi:hypothetical protein